MEKEPAISSENEIYIMNPSGNTGDIIQSILEADKYGVEQVEDFAHTMQGEDILETCANLYHWVRQHIPYQEDPSGLQLILLPGQLYANRKREYGGTGLGGDCKSMSLFCSSVLRALGNYDFQYRFSSERPNTDFHHVYLVVRCGDEYIPLDCTHKEFCTEFPYAKKKDIAPRQPASLAASTAPSHRIAGIGTGTGKPLMNVNNPANTVAALDDDFWEEEINYFNNNSGKIRDEIKQRCINGIEFKYANQPLRRNEFKKAFNKLWNELFKYASCVIYHYWNDKQMYSFYASRPGVNTPADVPFPQEYAAKMQTSKEFFSDLKEIGLREDDIYAMCNYGVYFLYGITLDYMLYRCYCLQLYGQPFSPKNGVPYFNNKTGVLVANGAPLQDVIGIGLCFPAEGGIGRPFGQPYWCIGGYILNNGATDSAVEKFAVINPRPGTVRADGSIVPGNIANNGNGISEEAQAQALVIYNKWKQGNMVVLPAPVPETVGQGKPGIGYVPVAEIVAIVVGVSSAVSTIVGMVIAIVKSVQANKNKDNLPLPTQDFKWEYKTVDGCYIGNCVSQNCAANCKTVKYCPDGTKECNPDLNDPNNQSPQGSFGAGNKKTMMTVGGIAMASAGFLLMD